MPYKTFDKQVQVRLSDELHTQLIEKADRDGVHVAEWARRAILACTVVPPAKEPQPAGRGKMSIRFRADEYKLVRAAQRKSRRDLSDFLRACLQESVTP